MNITSIRNPRVSFVTPSPIVPTSVSPPTISISVIPPNQTCSSIVSPASCVDDGKVDDNIFIKDDISLKLKAPHHKHQRSVSSSSYMAIGMPPHCFIIEYYTQRNNMYYFLAAPLAAHLKPSLPISSLFLKAVDLLPGDVLLVQGLNAGLFMY